MIEQAQIMSLLLEACPSFERDWRDHAEEYGQDLIYVALGSFARHLLALYREGRTECFHAVCEVIERLHLEGSHYTREAATIGLLESVQNVWKNCGTDPELFRPFLGPESERQWQNLNDIWAGRTAKP